MVMGVRYEEPWMEWGEEGTEIVWSLHWEAGGWILAGETHAERQCSSAGSQTVLCSYLKKSVVQSTKLLPLLLGMQTVVRGLSV